MASTDDPAGVVKGDGMFTTFSKYGLLGCCVRAWVLFGLRSQKADAEAHAAAMGQLYALLKTANDSREIENAASRVERSEMMKTLLGVKTEAAAAKVAATAAKVEIKADVAKVQAVTEKTMKSVQALEP